MDQLKKGNIELVACIARNIWLKQNKQVFEGVFLPPRQLIQRATEQLEAAMKVNQGIRSEGEENRMQSRACWEAPPFGVVKCNWDVANDFCGRRMGVGVVARNHAGEVLVTKCMTMVSIMDPQTAEALAARAAAKLVHQFGYSHVILEGDALVVVKIM